MVGGNPREDEGHHADGEAGGSLRAVEGVLRGEGRQAASEEAALPVGRGGAAATVGCSCFRSCGVCLVFRRTGIRQPYVVVWLSLCPTARVSVLPFSFSLWRCFVVFFRVGEKDNVDFPLKKEGKIKKRNRMWEKPKT